MTVRESIPAVSTPTDVTVKSVRLYWTRLASVGGRAGRPSRATRFGARRSSRNTLRFLLTRGDERAAGGQATLTLWIGWWRAIRSLETRRFFPSLPIARPFFVDSTVTVAWTTSPRCSIWTDLTSKFRKTFATNLSGCSEYSTTWMSLLIRRFSFAMFSPFLPIALPMSPSLTPKMSLSPASTQSTTVVRVRSWNNATYLIVCSSKTISAMRILDGQDVRFPRADHRDGRDGKGHAAGGAEIHVRAAEAKHADVPEVSGGLRGAIRGEDHELRLLRLRCAADLAQAEAHLAGVGGDAEGAGDVDHGTTSSKGSSGAGTGGGGVTAGLGFATAVGFGSPGGGL